MEGEKYRCVPRGQDVDVSEIRNCGFRNNGNDCDHLDAVQGNCPHYSVLRGAMVGRNVVSD